MPSGISRPFPFCSKFLQGAWLTLLVIPPLLWMYWRVRHYNRRLERDTSAACNTQLEPAAVKEVLIVIPLKRLDHVAQRALRVALGMSGKVVALQILAEDMRMADLSGSPVHRASQHRALSKNWVRRLIASKLF